MNKSTAKRLDNILEYLLENSKKADPRYANDWWSVSIRKYISDKEPLAHEAAIIRDIKTGIGKCDFNFLPIKMNERECIIFRTIDTYGFLTKGGFIRMWRKERNVRAWKIIGYIALVLGIVTAIIKLMPTKVQLPK